MSLCAVDDCTMHASGGIGVRATEAKHERKREMLNCRFDTMLIYSRYPSEHSIRSGRLDSVSNGLHCQLDVKSS